MRIFFAVILGVLFFCGRGAAQEGSIGSATSALQDVLSNLKESVEKLGMDNDQLAARDNAVKQDIAQMQAQLEKLEAQGDVLNKSAAQLQEKNPGRSEKISRLEEENSDLDDRIQKAQGGIKLVQQSMASGYQEDQKLLLQLKATANVLPPPVQVPSPESQAAARLQMEKLKLMKMIYESQQRQESLHKAIFELQKNTPLLPAAGALAHQQLLKEQIKDLEDQITAYPSAGLSANPGYVNQWDSSQLVELESELKALERNYLQLKDLMEEMTKRSRSKQMTVSQHVEEKKLQGSIDDMSRQSVGLRVDLDDLRSQMVDLDKRKSRLEDMIKQLP